VIALERKTWHAQSSGGRVPGWIGALTLLPVMSEAHGTARPGSRERGEVTLRRLVADVAVGVESRPGSPPPLGTTLAMAACAEERELAHVELRF